MTGHECSNSELAIHWTALAEEDLAPLLHPNMHSRLGNYSYRALRHGHGVDSFSTTQKMRIRKIGSFAACMAASKNQKQASKRIHMTCSNVARAALYRMDWTNKRLLAPSIYLMSVDPSDLSENVEWHGRKTTFKEAFIASLEMQDLRDGNLHQLVENHNQLHLGDLVECCAVSRDCRLPCTDVVENRRGPTLWCQRMPTQLSWAKLEVTNDGMMECEIIGVS